MNTTPQRRNAAGFTLVELLTVITIIVILAGLTVGGLSYYNRRVAEDKTRMQIKLLSNGLETYFFDFGEYPMHDNPDPQGRGQSYVLYEYLFFDTDQDDITYEDDDDQKIYVVQLDPDSRAQGWISGKGTGIKLLDGFGNEYRYRKLDDPTQMRNPDFDLWSVGPDGESNTDEVKHEDNRDDIW